MLLGACTNRPELINDFEVVALVPGSPLRERYTGELSCLCLSLLLNQTRSPLLSGCAACDHGMTAIAAEPDENEQLSC